jgi:pimeloyl-ACP methyl ester carboxylesterase
MFALPAERVIEAPCPAEARSLDRRAECGFVAVPLDREEPNGKKIRIYFERYPRGDRSRPPLATVVSVEGGPGYPTTPDRAGRVQLWRPVSGRRDLLLVDLRGTGKSGALGCQAFARSTRKYVARAGRCAAQRGPSVTSYLAVICQDYPQLWDPATPVVGRLDEVTRRLAAYPKGTFAPLSPSAWIGTDYEGVLACLRWPSPTRFDPPDPPGAAYPDVPTLVLNGDLDTITASSGAREVARRFPRSSFVELRNSLHVTVLYDRDACASRLYVRFVRRLDPGDTTCAGARGGGSPRAVLSDLAQTGRTGSG